MTATNRPTHSTFDDVDLSAYCRPPAAAPNRTQLPPTKMTLEQYHQLVFQALLPYREAYDAANEAIRQWYLQHEPPTLREKQ